MSAVCGVADLLRSSGPVRVPLRECCAAALFGVEAPVRCAALPLEPAGPPSRVARPLPGGGGKATGKGDRIQARQ